MRRYIIIIGAMKSGTTTLFDLLARHPAIAPSLDKEPGFFAFEEKFSRGFDWFDTLFEFDEAVHRYRLEASTDYTKAPFVTGAWDRMTADPSVEVKLLYIMRHPLQRIESHANHTQRKRKEIGQVVSPRPDHGLDAGLSPVSLMVSAYATQLDQYSAARAAGNLHWLTLEELTSDPEATLGAIWRFLGLDAPGPVSKVTAQNVSANRTELHPIWGRITGNPHLLGAAKALLPRGARGQLKSMFQRKVIAEGRFSLTAEERAALSVLFDGEMARLRQDYGVDTAARWGL
jgi:hypothetical protein